MNILGISCYYHEAAAAMVVDGKLVSAQAQERSSRVKHDAGFPTLAIKTSLREAGIRASQLDWVVFYEKPLWKFSRNVEISLRYFPKSALFFTEAMRNALAEKLWIKSNIVTALNIHPDKVLFVPQHLSHAAASFYPSPFQEAAFLTLDGVGEWTTGCWGVGEGHLLRPMGEMRFPHSVGLLYSTFTAWLGFAVNDGEYKVMGMAGYGHPRYVNRIKKLYRQHADGSIVLNLEYFAFHKSTTSMFSRSFERLFSGVNRFDVAASLQEVIEEIILKMVDYVWHKTGKDYLVYAGGVALNSVVNANILAKSKFKDIFIFPAAGDDGGAAGAALYVYHHILGHKRRRLLEDVFLGSDVEGTSWRGTKQMGDRQLVVWVARQLSLGRVVGWCEGRSEFGPRALGHRSILADPRDPNMKERVNAKIKFREEFRPFAPVVLAQEAPRYFRNININVAKFMLGTFAATDLAKKKAPAVVHIDGTSRIQIVEKNYQGRLRKLLQAFYKITGVPILLNTSFNLKGEPIVNTAADARRTFYRSGLDVLVVGNHIIEKKYGALPGIHESAIYS
ncbi:MAG TPA: hypothetical protein DCS09_01250 [Porphyromonadaceae bacterium]|nr:hypothetical protein [Porphyromonadaceae bacterium]